MKQIYNANEKKFGMTVKLPVERSEQQQVFSYLSYLPLFRLTRKGQVKNEHI